MRVTRTAYLVRSGRLAGGVVCAALALTACGSAGGSATPTPSTAAAASNGVAAESPAQQLAAAQAALRSAKGFVGVARVTENGQRSTFEFVAGADSKISLQLHRGATRMKMIVTPAFTYIEGNADYWKATAASRSATLLADRWVEIPSSKKVLASMGFYTPTTLSKCLGEDLGKLSRGGTTIVDGHPAVVIHEDGNVPGGSPGDIAVAMNGPPYPLRVTATGATRRGGKVDACNNGQGADVLGTFTFSDFGDPPPIKVPAHALVAGKRSGSSV